jgi:hypothetical protein
MKFSFDNKRIVFILFFLAFILLILNALAPRLMKHTGTQSESVELSSDEIKQNVIAVIKEFGIRDEWIEERKIKSEGNDSLRIFLKIDVPKDIPIAIIINDIKNSFRPGEISYTSYESKVNGFNHLLINSGGFEKLKADFVYNPGIQRTLCSIGFLISGFHSLDTALQDQLIKAPESFMAVLIPSADALERVKKLKSNNKDYAVLLSTDNNDLDYKLSPSYSPERLKISIRTILGNFPDAIAYFYNGKSDFTSSSKFSFIMKEFEKRGVRFGDINKFDLIDERGTPLDISFQLIVNEASENKAVLICISAENYIKLKPLISKYRKIGYKFINPAAVLQD